MADDAKVDNEGIAELRKAYEKLQKDYNDLSGRFREVTASTAAREVGLNDQQVELFLKVHDGDVTVDAMKGFAEQYGLKPPTTPDSRSEETAPDPVHGATPADDGQALSGMSGAGSQATGGTPPSSPGKKLTFAEFQSLLSTDRAQAEAAYAEGRVERPAGSNPFAS